MTVICPGDAFEVREAVRAALNWEGPVYIRLGKKGEPLVHNQAPAFTIGKGIVVRTGDDVCFLSTGNMLPTVIRAADRLCENGVSAQVVSLHTVKPLDETLLSQVFSRYTLVITVEEHSLLGGLGGSVAEWVSDQPGAKAPLLRMGTADGFLYESGEQEYARYYFGLIPEIIAKKTLQRYLEIGAGSTIA